MCVECGEELVGRARFCAACGAPVREASAAQVARTTATALFCDVVGSTALGERLDPEAVRAAMNRYFTVVSAAVQRHGGSVEKFIGDAVVALFGVPRAHEDDALRAVRAGIEARAAVRALGDDLESSLGVRIDVRIGITTGEVVVGGAPGGERVATGDTMNTAARLESAAPAGGILIGESTLRLVRHAVVSEPVAPLQLKGKAGAVPAFRVLDLRGVSELRARTPSRFVGRERERRRLQAVIDAAHPDGSCALVTVVGAAGVGKSRLVAEVLANASLEVTVAYGRCLSYGEGITHWPAAEAIRSLAGVEQADDAARVRARIAATADAEEEGAVVDGVASLLGLPGPAVRIEDAWIALRTWLRRVSRERRVVFVLDDLHWAEEPLLDLVEFLAGPTGEPRLLILCMARPELFDVRPEWGAGSPNASTLELEPLSTDDCRALVARITGEGLPDDVGDRITAVAEGNPLFVEELIGMLVEDGSLDVAGGRAVVLDPAPVLRMPVTIQALLAARLDQLSEAERGAVDRASIEGQVFHVGALHALGLSEGDVAPALRALVRNQLLRPENPSLPGQRAYGFRHLLIRDAAYERILRERRAAWHEALAGWLERIAGDRIGEYAEVIAHHFAQASRHRAAIGGSDAHGRELGRRAAALYRNAADRAAAGGDTRSAEVLLAEAADLLPREDRERAVVLADRAWMLSELTRVADATTEAIRARQAAEATGDDATKLLADIVERGIRLHTTDAAAGDHGEVEAFTAAGAAVATLDPTLRPGEVGRVLLRLAEHEADMFLRYGTAAAMSRQALELLLRTGNPWLEYEALLRHVINSMRGPGRISLLVTSESDPAGRGRAFECQFLAERASLLAQTGDGAAAAADLTRATTIAHALDWPDANIATRRSGVLASMGDVPAAIAEARFAFDAFLGAGMPTAASTCGAELARQLALVGEIDDASNTADRARSLTLPADAASALYWRCAKALVHVARGEGRDAALLAIEIERLVAGIEHPIMEFDGRVDAAEAWRAAGDRARARTLLQRAVADSEARGAAALARQASAALEELMVGR